MRTVLGTGNIVENDKGEILLGKKRDGRIYPDCWITPGGGIEEGETIEESAKREIREETGLEVEIIKRLNFDEDFTVKISKQGIKEDIHIVTLNFLTHVTGGVLKTEEDLVDATWFPKEQLKYISHNPLSLRLFKILGWI